jgi:ribosome biogenesis protein Nip4
MIPDDQYFRIHLNRLFVTGFCTEIRWYNLLSLEAFMQLKKLTDTQLLDLIKGKVLQERKLGAEILRLLCELERRKVYADLGYSSLFLYLTKGLHYSESDAWRKIQAAKLLADFPEIEVKIEEGSLNLSSLTTAAQHFHQHKQIFKTREDKEEMLTQLEHLSKREVERVFVQKTGELSPAKETPKLVSPAQVQITLTIDEKLERDINQLKAMKNRKRHLSTAELLKMLVTEELAREEKKKTTAHRTFPGARSAGVVLTRALLKESGHQCSVAGCGERSKLEIDHIKPWILGGETSNDNLRVLCRGHHQRLTRKSFN